MSAIEDLFAEFEDAVCEGDYADVLGADDVADMRRISAEARLEYEALKLWKQRALNAEEQVRQLRKGDGS